MKNTVKCSWSAKLVGKRAKLVEKRAKFAKKHLDIFKSIIFVKNLVHANRSCSKRKTPDFSGVGR